MMQLRTKKTERSTTHQDYPRIVPLILFASEKKQRKKKASNTQPLCSSAKYLVHILHQTGNVD
jgi:hypothetical protein